MNFEYEIKVLILMYLYRSFGMLLLMRFNLMPEGMLLLMRFNLMPLVILNDNIQNT